MSVDLTTAKKLYAFSYNECAHPDCTQILVEIDAETQIAVNYGELAHIHGQKPDAERFLQEIYEDKEILHGFDNILILCSRHHHQVDQKGAGRHYTADLLRTWKSEHIQRKSATELDREWVYGGRTIAFFAQSGEQFSLSYWITKGGEIRFHTPTQLAQTNAARELALLFSQVSSLISVLDQASGNPADMSRQTENDAYMSILKKHAGDLKKGWLGGSAKNSYESAIHRIYENLTRCPDITLAELAEVGTEKREARTTLIVGDVTSERIGAAIEHLKNETGITKLR